MATTRTVVAVCLIVRILQSTLLIKTYFNPDEYWQSLEVAHRLVFGLSGAQPGIPCPLLSITTHTKILRTLRLDTPTLVLLAPKLLQACVAAYTDYHVWQLATQLFGRHVAKATLACQLTSWFNAYCLVRTFSSSCEAGLLVHALRHYLRLLRLPNADAHDLWRWAALAALGAVVRPPSALFWTPAGLLLLWRHGLGTVAPALPVGIGVVLCSCLVDSVLYKRPVIPAWEFIRFNLLQSGSRVYGTHPWHWNATVGLPVVLSTLLVPLAMGVMTCWRHYRLLPLLLAWQVAVYSVPAHKEFRFLLPALQLAMPMVGVGMAAARGMSPTLKRCCWAALIAPQLITAAYLGLRHQRGTMDLMPYLVQRARCLQPPLHVALLMPCHATPGYSHLHTPRVQLWGLDCSPPAWADATQSLQVDPWGGASQAVARAGCGNRTQAACFAQEPQRVVGALFRLPTTRLLTHVAVFEHSAIMLAALLKRQGFVEERRWWHADVAVDDTPPGHVVLFRRRRLLSTC